MSKGNFFFLLLMFWIPPGISYILYKSVCLLGVSIVRVLSYKQLLAQSYLTAPGQRCATSSSARASASAKAPDRHQETHRQRWVWAS